MARSGTETRKRNKLLAARCNEEEFEFALLKAERAGLCLSSLIRHLVLEEPKRHGNKSPSQRQKDIAKLIGLLGQNAQALRDLCQKKNIPPNHPLLTSIWRDIADITALCFETLGKKP